MEITIRPIKTEEYGTLISLPETIIKFARVNKCKKVHWQVSTWNKNAQDFYKKMGARISEGEWNCDLMLN